MKIYMSLGMPLAFCAAGSLHIVKFCDSKTTWCEAESPTLHHEAPIEIPQRPQPPLPSLTITYASSSVAPLGPMVVFTR